MNMRHTKQHLTTIRLCRSYLIIRRPYMQDEPPSVFRKVPVQNVFNCLSNYFSDELGRNCFLKSGKIW